MKKTLLALILLLVTFTCFNCTVMAEENVHVVLDGEPIHFDVPAQIIDGRTMVPIRAIFEKLGMTVEWFDKTQTVKATKRGIVVEFPIGSTTVSRNTIKQTIDVPAQLVGNSTLVPVRFVSEFAGAEVVWDGNTNTVFINSTDTIKQLDWNDTYEYWGEVKDGEASGYGALYNKKDGSLKQMGKYINSKLVDGSDFSGKGMNLFDKSQPLEAGFVSITGTVGSTAYSHFYFPIDLSKTYTFPVYTSYTGVANAPKIAVYDTEKTYMGAIAGTLSDDRATATVNLAQNTLMQPATGKALDKTNAAYLCINVRPADANDFMIVEGDTYPDMSSQEEEADINPDKGSSGSYDNPLYGKKISLNGDSICHGGSISCLGGFGKIIADNNAMEYQNIAVSGATIMQDPENPNKHCISKTIVNMDADADYIILEGGVNDASKKFALGTITDGYDAKLDTNTFAGAFEYMLKQAILRFPGKKIGYVFVHKMTDGYLATDEDGSKETYYTIAKKCCRKWGIPYIDLNAQTPISRYIPELRDAYTIPHPTLEQGDGWHPNKEGYQKFYVPQIEAWMKTL